MRFPPIFLTIGFRVFLTIGFSRRFFRFNHQLVSFFVICMSRVDGQKIGFSTNFNRVDDNQILARKVQVEQ